ncbi:MAG: zf-TFIIB domain-containing protein [Planctomycetales bacterium]|nr:zf-TFIIB domain-containing protein [Planctomycetales bacterium]
MCSSHRSLSCEACGAPVSAIDGREHFLCQFCDSLVFGQPLESCQDRIVTTEDEGDGTCPRCDQPLRVGKLDHRNVEYCQTCRGIWLSTNAFVDVLNGRRSNYRGPQLTPVPLDPKELDVRRPCPGCRRVMEVHPYHGKGNAVIDSCHRCLSIWLDPGEITSLERV